MYLCELPMACERLASAGSPTSSRKISVPEMNWMTRKTLFAQAPLGSVKLRYVCGWILRLWYVQLELMGVMNQLMTRGQHRTCTYWENMRTTCPQLPTLLDSRCSLDPKSSECMFYNSGGSPNLARCGRSSHVEWMSPCYTGDSAAAEQESLGTIGEADKE
jgi:hypothetical protein